MATPENSSADFNLAEARLNRGWTLDAAARQIGVPRHVLFHAESGGRPRPASALKIASFYGYRVTDLWPVGEPEAA